MNNRPENKDMFYSSFSFFPYSMGNIYLRQEVQLNTKIKDISYKFYFKKEPFLLLHLI